MPSHTIIDFQDDRCNVLHWESSRNTYTLRHVLTLPFAKKSNGHELPALALEPAPEGLPGAQETTEEPVPDAAAPASGQDTAAALRKALRKAGLKVQKALALVPKHWATLRVVTLPATEPEELAEMAQFEAERHIPFNVDRHVIAHHVLSSEGIAGSHVVLAAIDGPPAQQITELFDAAGIQLAGIEISAVALVNALLHSGVWDREANPTVVHVNVGENNTDIVILLKGEPIFARSAPLGADKVRESLETTLSAPKTISPEPIVTLREPGQAFSETPGGVTDLNAPPQVAARSASPQQNRLIREVRQTLDYAQREFDSQTTPSRIFLSGPGAGIPGLTSVFDANFGVETVVLDPFSAAASHDSSIRLRRKIKDAQADANPSAYTLAAGGLLAMESAKALRVNLMPPAYLRTRVSARRRRMLVLVAAVAVLGLVGAFWGTSQVLADKEQRLEALEAQIKQHAPEVADLEYRQEVARILEDKTSQRGSSLDILDTISQWKEFFQAGRMKVSVTDFEYGEKLLKIDGFARTQGDLNDFVALLESSGHFDRVKATRQQSMEAPNNRDVTVVSYSIGCLYKEKKSSDRSR